MGEFYGTTECARAVSLKLIERAGVRRQIDPPALFLAVSAPFFVRHVDVSQVALLAVASQQQGAAGDEDLLAFYHGVRELKDMFTAFCPE